LGLAYDGLLGLHIIFALAWLVVTFVGIQTLLSIAKSPGNVNLVKRSQTLQSLIAATGGITVLIGIGFLYYVDVYRKSLYGLSGSELPLIGAGAALGLVAFILQMIAGPRIRHALKAGMPAATPTQTPTPSSSNAMKLPPAWMTLIPAVLLLIALALMIGGSMM
jgi:hypothetical protein